MAEQQKRAKWKTLSTIAQSGMVLVLIGLVVAIIVQVNRLQETARVINYAGLVRGATQREIKLEITGSVNDDLIEYLDDILSGLRYEKGSYDLVRLDDDEYQKKLDTQMEYWEQLKKEIRSVREKGYQDTEIVSMSEIYFLMADETVSAAERYSEQIARTIRILEIASAVDMLVLILIMIHRTVITVQITRKNKKLEEKAYIDLHTGLPNKSRCEEFFHDGKFIQKPVACMVFDLNNLKLANDTLGHSVGDQLILNFARLLRNVIPAKDFVGRYGGDEFMVVMNDANNQEINEVLIRLKEEVDCFNKIHHGGNVVAVSYACGWALSTDYEQCTFRTLFDKADKNMYLNKQAMKNNQ